MPFGWSASIGKQASTDGTTIVGQVSKFNPTGEGSLNKACVWVDGDPFCLDHVNVNHNYSDATGVSADGSVVVGLSAPEEDGLSTAFRWESGQTSELTKLPMEILYPYTAVDVSADGSIVLGSNYADTGNYSDRKIIRWVDGTPETIAQIDGLGTVNGMSGDGRVIIGSDLDDEEKLVAKLWTEANNWEPIVLNDLLDEAGIDREGYTLHWAADISDDGKTIVGRCLGGGISGYMLRICEMYGCHEVTDGTVDSGSWMGTLFVEYEPWVWCHATGCWFYIPDAVAQAECGWIYLPDPVVADQPPLWFTNIAGSSWFWSYGLSKWFYYDPANNGWAFLVG